jgi:nucleoside-diphosphate-sugar epimerase
MTTLVLGGTGRVGALVSQQLLERGLSVRAIVRSPEKLPDAVSSHANFSMIQANLLDVTEDEMVGHLNGCDAVVSCLGHVMSFGGIFGHPRSLVTQATTNVSEAIEKLQPDPPIKFVVLNTVGVQNPVEEDRVRGWFEGGFVWTLATILPPFNDSVQSANYLCKEVGTANPHIEWSLVRPDAFIEGDVSEYALHETIQSSMFSPGQTTMANVAHFMGELVQNPETWNAWKFKMPVILNKSS